LEAKNGSKIRKNLKLWINMQSLALANTHSWLSGKEKKKE
jgi:hypothetical protein